MKNTLQINRISVALCIFFVVIQPTGFYSQTQVPLQRVTVGFGAGYSHLNETMHGYALSTDTLHALKVQNLTRDNFVISSVISVKIFDLNTPTSSSTKLVRSGGANSRWYEPITVNLAVNLLEVNSQNVSFNKSIDGGLGIGYYLNTFTQLSVFYDIIRVRQLRNYVVESYENARIPNEKSFYNALDESNNDLFYTRNIPGFSFKAVFTVGNK